MECRVPVAFQIATGDDARSEGQPSHPLLLRLKKGEVRERPNRAVSKTAVPLRGPWVRIPPSPPFDSRVTLAHGRPFGLWWNPLPVPSGVEGLMAGHRGIW